MPNIYQNISGSFTAVKEIFVKDGGSWRTITEVWVNVAGTWQKVFPESSGTQTYTTPGTYSFTVPNGVYSITVNQLVGAGGGAGGNNSNGDILGASGGGSGGYYTSQVISVTPGETLTITVGYGGYGGNFRFNSSYSYFNDSYTDNTLYHSNPGTYDGGAGDSSSIARGATTLLSASGGSGGLSNWFTSGGAGGSPNGVAGCNAPTNYSSCVDLGTCGVNALGIGSGGGAYGCSPGRPGNPGKIEISW